MRTKTKLGFTLLGACSVRSRTLKLSEMPGRRNDLCPAMAANKKWGEVLSTLNRGDAGFDDYEVRAPRLAPWAK